MVENPTVQDICGLLDELRMHSAESTWVDFKVNNSNPQAIGEYLSALSNAAVLAHQPRGYLVWGIVDKTHNVVGTTFRPTEKKKGNEDLTTWLLRLLDPKLDFRFYEVTYEGHFVVVLEVPCATSQPVQFSGERYVRIGSSKRKLRDHPQIERELWKGLDSTPFEARVALGRINGADVEELLDYASYFALLKLPKPAGRETTLARLAKDDIVEKNQFGSWNITNLGALLFARDLNQFSGLRRKAVRIVGYEGSGRVSAAREQIQPEGYAAGIERVVDHVRAVLPQREELTNGIFRNVVHVYPEVAIRELITNALIHQDFSASGTGPMIEIFDHRIEITNPGTPLISADRFLDEVPKSRNERIASLLRRMGICEERGSGVDKVVLLTELHQLPAPVFKAMEHATRATLFGPRAFVDMDRADRILACYLHACLRYVNGSPMTNSSLRKRFGIDKASSATVSRIISSAQEAGRIKPYDWLQRRKFAKYLPFWA